MLTKKTILVTGSSGFIGFHISKKLLEKKFHIIGIDNHNNYYDPKIKIKRLKMLKKYRNFKFFKADIKNKSKLLNIFRKTNPGIVINLAAQAGVRYSFVNPQKYINSNVAGFINILEIMKMMNIKNLIYASSSSVYGNCKNFPFKENSKLNPLNFYGQTKLFNEKITGIYKDNFAIKSIGLRFFTVYGPFGRPDMFIPKILNKIKKNKIIDLYNNGNHYRDFTFVEDISDIMLRIVNNIDKKFKSNLFNVCSGKTLSIKKIIETIEKNTKKKIKLKLMPFQIGDMKKTHGSNLILRKTFKFKKFKDFNYGIKKTIAEDFFN